jgi:hypothetical protein
MPMFTTAQIVSITRRMINIVTENTAYTTVGNNLTTYESQLLAIDNGNQVIYDLWYNSCLQYENEYKSLAGVAYTDYTNGTVMYPYPSTGTGNDIDSAYNGANNPSFAAPYFYPSGWQYLLPTDSLTPSSTSGALNGHPITGPSGVYELKTLNDATTPISSLYQAIHTVTAGFTGSGATTSTVTSIPAGSPSITLSVASAVGFTVGDYLLIFDGAINYNSGIFNITNIVGTNITVSSILASASVINNGKLVDGWHGFSDVERTLLTASQGGEVLQNLLNIIKNFTLTTWSGQLTTQSIALGSNGDNTSPSRYQNSYEKTNTYNGTDFVNSIINNWNSAPDSGGPYAKLSNYWMNNILTSTGLLADLVNRRIARIPVRVSQIISSLGLVVVINDTTPPTGSGAYLNRYTWLNIRINRVSGSASRFFLTCLAGATNTTQIANNNAALAAYSVYFIVQRISTIDPNRPIITVADSSVFSPGDICGIVSDTQPVNPDPIMMFGVVDVLDEKQIVLDKQVPNVFTSGDLMRIYKELI